MILRNMFLSLLCLLFFHAIPAQELVKVDENFKELDSRNSITMYIDNDAQMDFNSVRHQVFQKFSNSLLKKNKSNAILWLKLSIQNVSNRALHPLFHIGKLFYIDLYQVNTDNQIIHQTGGTFSDWQGLKDGYALPIHLKPLQSADVFIRIGTDEVFSMPLLVIPKLYESAAYESVSNEKYKHNTDVLILYFLTIGFLVCSIVIAIFQYFSFRDPVVLYYIGVILISILMILRVAEFNLDVRFISKYFPSFFTYIFTFQILFNYLYSIFFSKMLNLKKPESKFLSIITNKLTIHHLLIIISLILIYITMQERRVSTSIYLYSSLLVSLSFLHVIYIIIKKSYNFSTYYQYIVYGFISLHVCYFIAFCLIMATGPYNPNAETKLLTIPPFYVCLGTVIEFLFFMTALNHRIKLIETESILKGQALERKKISEDLQNNINSLLASIKVAIQSLIPAKNQEFIHQSLLKMIDNATKEVKNISQNMVPAELEKKGLVSALNTLVMRLNISNNINFELKTTALQAPLSAEISFQIYMICTELCQNIVKHSEASQAGIEVETTWEVSPKNIVPQHYFYLFVWDNGKGFEKEKVEGGMGFKNIKHRAEAIGAEYKVISQDNGSTFFLKIMLNE